MVSVFISQPMRAKTATEILKERKKMIEYLMEQYEENIEILDSFYGGDKYDPLESLAKSIEALSRADAAVFAPGWQNARGCRVEHQCCIDYGIPIIMMGDQRQ